MDGEDAKRGKFAEDMDEIGAGLDYVLKKARVEFNADLLENLKDETSGRSFGEQLLENAKMEEPPVLSRHLYVNILRKCGAMRRVWPVNNDVLKNY